MEFEEDMLNGTEMVSLSVCPHVLTSKRVPKGWGGELWIDNNEKYCGKILSFKKNHRCSWHYHLVKEETFYCLSGAFEVIYGATDEIKDAKRVYIDEGNVFHVPVGLRHSMLALREDSKLLEVSTHHEDDDSIRVLKGN